MVDPQRKRTEMLNADQNNPTEKPGQRKRKVGKRSAKSEQPIATLNQPLDSKADQVQDTQEPVSATVVSIDSFLTEASLTDTSTNTSPVSPAVPAEPALVSFQSIANAYGDYTMKSLERTNSFFEKLAGVRTFDKAFELQTEFAREACDTFVVEWQKIGELHSELAVQRLKRLEGFVDQLTQSARAHGFSGVFGQQAATANL